MMGIVGLVTRLEPRVRVQKSMRTGWDPGEPASAQGKPVLMFDTSAINRLADDGESGPIQAGIRTGFWFRLSGDSLGELIATTHTARRKLLLDLCKRLLAAGDCLLPHDEVLKELIKQDAKSSSFNWEAVPVRCKEYEEEIARQELIDDEIARQQRCFAGEVGNEFAEIYERARPHFQKLFRRRSATPVSLPQLISALQGPSGAFWSLGAGCYRKAAGATLDEAATRNFVDICPPFRALLIALCVAQHQRSIQNPRQRSTGVFDLYASVYLPYCEQFVTADPGQEAALLQVASLAKLTAEVRSYTNLRARLLGLKG